MPAHRSMLSILALAVLVLLASTALFSDAQAYSSFFNSRCASCHNNDTQTCNGCHRHRGNLSANPDEDGYLPGSLVTVTLNGGQQSGWIRGILYDENDVEIARATGPTGTGDDGLGNPVTFPVSLQASAPVIPGQYAWEAAWYGSVNSGGGTHTESRVPVTITVQDLPSSVPLEPPYPVQLTWGTIKALFR